MRKIAVLLIIFVFLFSSCEKNRESEGAIEVKEMPSSSYDINALPSPSTLSERFSYAYGNLLAESLESSGQEVDRNYFVRGFLDYYQESIYSEDELDQIFIEYQNEMLIEAENEFTRLQSENLQQAEEFLRVNGRRSGVITTRSGLEYEVVRAVDDAESPKEDGIVLIDYTMTLLNGQIIDSSYDRGESAEMALSSLIEGAREGICLMKEGERFRFWIHPDLAYGESGVGPVGPNELLIFEVELLDILN